MIFIHKGKGNHNRLHARPLEDVRMFHNNIISHAYMHKINDICMPVHASMHGHILDSVI